MLEVYDDPPQLLFIWFGLCGHTTCGSDKPHTSSDMLTNTKAGVALVSCHLPISDQENQNITVWGWRIITTVNANE